MAEVLPSFNRQAVEPIECLKSGFALIKDRYWLFFGITAIGMLIASLVPMGILMGPMMCGMYLAFFEKMRGRNVEFGLLFKGFDYFAQSLIATLLVMLPIFLITIPFTVLVMAGSFAFAHRQQQGGGNQPDPKTVAVMVIGIMVFVVVMMIIGLMVGVIIAFAYPLIVDRKLSAIQAIKTSLRASMANFWRLVGLLLLNALLGMVGALFCYVGALFIMPVTMAANAMAYRQVFGLSENPPPISSVPPVQNP